MSLRRHASSENGGWVASGGRRERGAAGGAGELGELGGNRMVGFGWGGQLTGENEG